MGEIAQDCLLNPHQFFAQAWQRLDGKLPVARHLAFGSLGVIWEAPDGDWSEFFGRALPMLSEGAADLQIRVFDRSRLSLLPPLPINLREASERGRLDTWCTPDFLAVAPPSSLFLADRTCGRGLLFYDDIDSVPIWDLCAPFRLLLGFLGPLKEHHLLHGAAVSRDGNSLLLVGPGGSGKSSTALAALNPRSSFNFITEDYAVVELKSVPQVHPFFRSTKVVASTLERMPWLADLPLLGEQQGKECRRIPLDRPLEGGQMVGIVWPDRSCEEALRPVTPGTAARALAPSTLFQNPNSGKDDFRAMTQLCKTVPCFRLGLGDSPGPAELELRLDQILKECISVSRA